MKARGILNGELAGRCARLGHRQQIAITDCGMPLPAGLPVVDLAVVAGLPRFTDVLDHLLDELVIEGHTIAAESAGQEMEGWAQDRADRLGPATVLSHEELKAALAECIFAVRTGENTPYANLILTCGVAF